MAAEFKDRERHLVKKTLAIAVLAIARQPGPLQAASDQSDVKGAAEPVDRGEPYARAAVPR
ncbi:hypothetical protein B5V02_21835 [Mesorhizobium kowhaii]|uniref:Uncharacterized protein n=1 Tax=Mesorhizobium kowhaii TaxID=1300272 RepID=A0A2W7CRU7_9HYPH|nr:hypothetical protein B5V02_21835 [Mesorhizobium kowhaii]